MSLPDIREPFVIKTASLAPDYVGPTIVGRITPQTAKERRALFETNKAEYLQNLNAAKNKLIAELPTGLNVYYFIGRLNPPHPGHIETLKRLIEKAREKYIADGLPFQVIILLGSGPGKKQTLNDPLDFELKKRVVIDLLQTEIRDINTLLENGSVAIEEMDKAATQISDSIKKIVKINETIIDIETVRFSGDKDEDVEKLAFIEESITKSLSGLDLSVVTSVVGIPALETENAGTAFSATEVRNDALRAYIEGGLNQPTSQNWEVGFYIFRRKYEREYDRNTQEIYNAIIKQANNLDEETIFKYIDYKTLPGSRLKKGPTSKKGGSRRRTNKRRKLTKRTNKRRKLTKRTNKRRRN